MDVYREYVGNLHVHSVYSDGTAVHKKIAAAAEAAGLNVVIVTDHNVRPEGLEGYYGRTLLLVGEEVHNVQRQPQANHLLVYGVQQGLAPHSFGSAQTLIKTARERGGICYIAHPMEKRSPLSPDLNAIPWVEWPIEGVKGMEIWNYMSEFKGLLWSKLAALVYTSRPEWGIRGPYRSTLKLWDELLNTGQRLSALGGADAHGRTYHWGRFERTVFPYRYLFNCVNTHFLTQGPMTGEVEEDRALVYEALQSGRTWVGYDLPYPTYGFRFVVRSGSAQVTVGEELKRLGALTLEIDLPAPGEIHLLRNGKRIQRVRGRQLRHTSAEPGIYRVEVYRTFWRRKVGWIYSSPIYVV